MSNEDDLILVSCSNPECYQLIEITKKQKRQFYLEFFLRCGRIELPYCCQACQEAHIRALSGNKQFKKQSIKDRGEGLIKV